jgi:hypothetical protein
MKSFKINGVLCYLRPSKKEGFDHIKIFEPLINLYIIPDIWSKKSYYFNFNSSPEFLCYC